MNHRIGIADRREIGGGVFASIGCVGAAAASAIMMLAPLGCAAGGGSGSATTNSLFPAEVSSVAVPIFDNRTLYTGLEREVTDALIKELQIRTPYRVTGAGPADSTLTGTIVSVEKTTLNRQRNSGLAQEILFSITVDFQWKDGRSGRILAERRRLTAGEEYIPSRPINEVSEIGRYSASAELARDIVSALEAEW